MADEPSNDGSKYRTLQEMFLQVGSSIFLQKEGLLAGTGTGAHIIHNQAVQVHLMWLRL